MGLKTMKAKCNHLKRVMMKIGMKIGIKKKMIAANCNINSLSRKVDPLKAFILTLLKSQGVAGGVLQKRVKVVKLTGKHLSRTLI